MFILNIIFDEFVDFFYRGKITNFLIFPYATAVFLDAMIVRNSKVDAEEFNFMENFQKLGLKLKC